MGNKNDKIKAIVATVIVHVLLLVLLAFLTLHAAKPEERAEDGVPVMMEEELGDLAADNGGTNEASAETDEGDGGTDASAEDAAHAIGNQSPQTTPAIPTPPAAKKEAPVEKPAAKPDPKPAKPTISQATEQSIAAQEAAKKKAAEQEAAARKKAAEEAAAKKAAEAAAAKKLAEEAAAKKKAEEAAAAAAASKVSGAFGKGSGAGKGTSTGNGSAAGSGDGGSGKGNGAGGVGGSASVGSRAVKYLATPEYADATNEGTIVVGITVDPQGAVVSATIKSSTTTSAPLRNAAIAAAKKSKFSEGSATESGTITYRFKLK